MTVEPCNRLAAASMQRLNDREPSSDLWLGLIYCHETHVVGPGTIGAVHREIQAHGVTDHHDGAAQGAPLRPPACSLTHEQHAERWRSWRDDCLGEGGCGYAQQDVDQCRRCHPDDGVTWCGACGYAAPSEPIP